MAQNLAITDPCFCDVPIEAVNQNDDDHDTPFFFSDSSRRSFLASPQMDLAASPLAFRRHPRHLDLLSIEFSDHRPYREPFLHLTRACLHHHRQRLTEAGILRPLWAAAHLFTDISPRALKELILRWSPPSKAFWRSGGWTTPTGEDVDCLAELSFEDDKDLVNISLGPNEVLLFDQLQKMTTALKNLGRELYISNWLLFLQGSVKADSVPFLTGALCVWLQLFICPSKSNILHPRFYRLACCLSAGHKLPLGSLFLGNLYLELDGIIERFLDGALHVSTCLNTQFLMLFIFERFPTVAPAKNVTTPSLVDLCDPEFFDSSFPRAILWHNVKVDPNMSIELALSHTALYCERPYLSRYSNIPSVMYPGIVRSVRSFMFKNVFPHASCSKIETWIATLLPHAIWALKEDDREVHRWVEMAYMPHLVMRQFGLDQTWPHYFDMGFLSKSRSKPMISHFLPYLQNLNAVPLPAYARVGRASSTFINRWTHFLGIVRVTRDQGALPIAIVPVPPGFDQVQPSPQKRPRQDEASPSSPRPLPKLLEDHSAKLARIEASLRETLQGGEPSSAIGGLTEQVLIRNSLSPTQAQGLISADIPNAAHAHAGGPPQNLNGTQETSAGNFPKATMNLVSSTPKVIKDIVNMVDPSASTAMPSLQDGLSPSNNPTVMITGYHDHVPRDTSTRLEVPSPRHRALASFIQLPRELNPTLQYWCLFYQTKDPGFLPMLDRLHDWFRYTVAATVGQILALFNAPAPKDNIPISQLRQEVLQLWAVVDRQDVKLPVLREMIESCRESAELVQKGEEVARAGEDLRAMMTRVEKLRASYEVMQEKCWPPSTSHQPL